MNSKTNGGQLNDFFFAKFKFNFKFIDLSTKANINNVFISFTHISIHFCKKKEQSEVNYSHAVLIMSKIFKIFQKKYK